MAKPSITSTNPVFELIGSGISYSRSITASNTPTSYAATGVPVGVSFNTSTGEFTGAPTATVHTSYSVSVTATNGDGTSDPQTWMIVVAPAVVGLAPDTFARALDLDMNFGTLMVPGVGSMLPAYRAVSPVTKDPQPFAFEGKAGKTVEPQYLTTWRMGERFTLSLGCLSGSVLQDVTANRLIVLLRGEEGGARIRVDEDDYAATGSGTTARHEVTVYLDPDLLSGLVAGFEDEVETVAPMLLGLRLEASTDAADFDTGTLTEAIVALDENDTVNDTFDINLADTTTTPLNYRIDLALVIPSDPGNGVSFTRYVTCHKSGGSYVIDSASGTTAATGTPGTSGTWAATLTLSSVTADATGFAVAVATTTSNPTPEYQRYVFEVVIGQDLTSTDEITFSPASSLHLYDVSDTLIGSAALTETFATGAALLAALDAAWDAAAGTAELVSVTAKVGTPTTAVFTILSTTAVRKAGFDSSEPPGSLGTGVLTSYPTQPDYSNAYVTCRVRGLSMPELTERISSAAVPILIERELSRD